MIALPRFTSIAAALPCALWICACGHDEAAGKPPATAPRPASAPDAGSTGASEQIEDYMADHFVIVTFSRDAVINGELEALREPLRVFAAYPYERVAPGGWMPWIAQIQEAARLTAEASTLRAAASGVATMARACGGCHQATGRGPDFGPSERERTRPPSDTLETRMLRHMYAADRMWEGLTGASDEAWQDGAAALAHTPAEAPVTEPPLPPPFVEALLATRELADAAVAATTPERRTEVYGAYLAACANCHAHGVDLAF